MEYLKAKKKNSPGNHGGKRDLQDRSMKSNRNIALGVQEGEKGTDGERIKSFVLIFCFQIIVSLKLAALSHVLPDCVTCCSSSCGHLPASGCFILIP